MEVEAIAAFEKAWTEGHWKVYFSLGKHWDWNADKLAKDMIRNLEAAFARLENV